MVSEDNFVSKVKPIHWIGDACALAWVEGTGLVSSKSTVVTRRCFYQQDAWIVTGISIFFLDRAAWPSWYRSCMGHAKY